MFKYLILVSSGFIGKNLCKYLRSQNCEVFEFDLKNNLSEDLRVKNNLKLKKVICSSDFIFF